MAGSGIYAIRNARNGKFYIGSATDIEQRWRELGRPSAKQSKLPQ